MYLKLKFSAKSENRLQLDLSADSDMCLNVEFELQIYKSKSLY